MPKVDIVNKDIVVVGLVAFNASYGNNCENIAIEFAKKNRVLFVNPPLDRNSIYKNIDAVVLAQKQDVLKGKTTDLKEVSKNLWVYTPKTILESINWLPVPFIHTIFNKINNKRYAGQIKSAIERLGFKNFMLFNDNDIFRSFYLKDYLKPEKYIYYIRDNLTVMDYWKRHGQRLEPKLFAKSDVIVANSTYLANYAKKYNNNSFYVGQGCDFTLFKSDVVRNEPEDMKNIPFPRVGYVGNLTSVRLDISLLVYLAKSKPEWSIVLIGPEDDLFKKSDLHKYSNVYFLGSKKMDVISDYVSHFDVCINPQVINPVTIGNYPRKIDEYLALGKPVVATKTMAMETFQEHTYLAESFEDYIVLIKKALDENNENKKLGRINFASQHTWENNVKEIYNSISHI